MRKQEMRKLCARMFQMPAMLAHTTCAHALHKSSGYAPAHALRKMHLPPTAGLVASPTTDGIFMHPCTRSWMPDGHLPGPE